MQPGYMYTLASELATTTTMTVVGNAAMATTERDAASMTMQGDVTMTTLLAAERLFKARRGEEIPFRPEGGPSTRYTGPRRPLGELPAAEVAPATQSVQIAVSASQLQPAPVSSYPQYSDSEIEDLYAPASPPHTPRERLPHALTDWCHGCW
jgi:hypothetical protein